MHSRHGLGPVCYGPGRVQITKNGAPGLRIGPEDFELLELLGMLHDIAEYRAAEKSMTSKPPVSTHPQMSCISAVLNARHWKTMLSKTASFLNPEDLNPTVPQAAVDNPA